PVQPAVRWRYSGSSHPTESKYAGTNPPKGAIIHYYLKEKAEKITLEILDAQGAKVQTLTSEKAKEEEPAEDDPDAPSRVYKPTVLLVEPGVQRVVWDLRYPGAATIKGAKIDEGNPRFGPLVNPGKYTLKLTVDGESFKRSLEVQPDPRVEMTPSQLG